MIVQVNAVCVCYFKTPLFQAAFFLFINCDNLHLPGFLITIFACFAVWARFQGEYRQIESEKQKCQKNRRKNIKHQNCYECIIFDLFKKQFIRKRQKFDKNCAAFLCIYCAFRLFTFFNLKKKLKTTRCYLFGG